MATVGSTAPTAQPASTRRVMRWRVLVAALLVALLAGGWCARWFLSVDRRLRAADELTQARLGVAIATAGLYPVVVPARAALSASAGRVDDEQERTALATALTEATAASHAAAATVQDLRAVTLRVTSARAALEPATEAVDAAVARWELSQSQSVWRQASAELAASVRTARDLLGTSSARVADDGVREALATAIDAAQSTLDAAEPTDAAGLRTAARALRGAADSLDAPVAAVAAAVDAWTSAQAAAAAAARQAAARAASPRAAPPAARTAPSTAASGDSHWEETVTYEDLRICMDTDGDSWEC